jgi:8-oxo-dGTP diphosphatase
MRESTCVYLLRDDQVLMLYRNCKSNDENHNKWIGVGGKRELGETIRACAIREVKEETGYDLKNPVYRGTVYFDLGSIDAEKIWLYTAEEFSGVEIKCNEGMLAWIDRDKIFDLSLWEGDRIFLKKILNGDSRPFTLLLRYDLNNTLLSAEEKEAEEE